LFEAALAGGKAATARPLGAIELGHRADFLILDRQSSALLGVPSENVLDALVFSSPDARFTEVYVGGIQRVAEGRVCGLEAEPELWPRLAQDFVQTMKTLWA
jgi:formimidoylglutamate deiminase